MQENNNIPGMDINTQKSENKGTDRVIIILLIIIAMMFLSIASVFAGYFVISGRTQLEKPANPVIEGSVPMSGIKLSDAEIPATYGLNMGAEEIKGVGTKSSVIDNLRSHTDSHLSSFKMTADANNVRYFTLEGEILRIDIPSGINGFNYSRSYYFNNGVLYFALIYSPQHQNSLYFHRGELYKYINEAGDTKQNDFKNDVFKTLGNFAVNEAYAFYDYKVGVKSVRN